jgi:hypothetical protein
MREPFFAIVRQGDAKLFLKAGEAAAAPNPKRGPAARETAINFGFRGGAAPLLYP